jgi:hypothetical protein
MAIDNSYRFFNNAPFCEYWPCHTGIPTEDFNCKFCLCPCYAYENCGGNYTVEKDIKDCSECILPHRAENYEVIIDFLKKNGAPIQK